LAVTPLALKVLLPSSFPSTRLTEVAEFPRQPSQIVRQFITEEADARLAKYRPLPPDVPPPPPEAPPHPTLPPDVVDAPLVRLFNFLRMC
jgi:mediator of RNA polymerase II transcription subunit 14